LRSIVRPVVCNVIVPGYHLARRGVNHLIEMSPPDLPWPEMATGGTLRRRRGSRPDEALHGVAALDQGARR
jgi:hypothetical protein